MTELLISKLTAPKVKQEFIIRPRLIGRLMEVNTRKATLLIAPAGYGKTILMAQIAEAVDRPLIWYQLDVYDNDPVVFLQYLAGGLQRCFPAFGREIPFLLEQGNIEVNLRLLLTKFIHSLIHGVNSPALLVFDDFHIINAPLVLQFIQELLEHLPPHIHLMIASRTKPLFTYTRLKVATEILTVGVEELAFNNNELQDYLAKNNWILTADAQESFLEKTNGWPAVIKLAVNSRANTFSLGPDDNNEIYEYLAKEVLEKQTEEIQEFLLKTAVLHVFTAENCDLLLKRTDSEQILNWLEERKLFLIPLKEEKAYRYHQLLREFLLARLGPIKTQLQLEAGKIAEQSGALDAAIEYYLDSGAENNLITIFREAGRQAFRKGRWQTVERWLGFFTPERIAALPWLALFKARVEAYRGGIEEMSIWLRRATAEFISQNDQEGLAESRFLEARVLRYQGFYRQSLDLIEKVSEFFTANNQIRFDIQLEKSFSLIMLGHFRAAEQLLKNALELAENKSNNYTIAYLLEGLGNTYYFQGEYAKALQVYQRRLKVDSEHDLHDYYALNYNAAIYQEWGELEQAYEYAKNSVSFKEAYGLTDTLPAAYFQLADVLINRNRFKEGEAYFRKAIALIEKNNRDQFFLILNKAYLAVSLIHQGHISEALLIMDDSLKAALTPGGLILAICQELAANIFWQSGQKQAAKEMLLTAIASLEKMGFLRPLGYAYATLSLFLLKEGDHLMAAKYARKTIEISAAKNFCQSFLTSFEIFKPVLYFGLEQGIEIPFIQNILARLGQRAFPLLHSLIEHPDPEVKLRLIVPLSEIGDVQSLQALRILQKDPALEVSQLAQEALLRIESFNSVSNQLENKSTGDVVVFKTLGPFILSQNGVELLSINWRTSKCRDLLAFLLYQGKPVPKDLILEELWCEYNLEKAQSIFHTVLYYLRQTFKNIGLPDLIVYRNFMYSLEPGYHDESRQFQDMVAIGLRPETAPGTACVLLERAISLYRGEYMTELDYPWLLPSRERLKNLYCEAQLKVAGLYLNKSEYQQAINHLQHVTEINPLSEEPYRILMNAYASSGDRSTVHQIYQKLANVLNEELGIVPSPETSALFNKLNACQ